MSEKKFLQIIILLLVLLNAGMLGFIWLHRPPSGGGNSAAIYLSHELKFTPEQKQAYQKMQHQHHQTIDSLRNADQEIQKQLFGLLQQNKPDTLLATQLANTLGKNRTMSELVTLRHFEEVKQLGTPEQQKKFAEVIEEALRMLKPPPPPPGR